MKMNQAKRKHMKNVSICNIFTERLNILQSLFYLNRTNIQLELKKPFE